MKLRVGLGVDVHAFGPGDAITLGGVRIPHHAGVLAHSDGDVLLHAICDALLGALALGDIGQHFPNTDPRYRGIDSRQLLRSCHDLVRDHGYEVNNLDCTVVCERPKLAPHVPEMRARIAEDLGVAADQISVKATTSERLGFTGRQEGLMAHAVVLLLAP